MIWQTLHSTALKRDIQLHCRDTGGKPVQKIDLDYIEAIRFHHPNLLQGAIITGCLLSNEICRLT